jgi:hypothetical protein
MQMDDEAMPKVLEAHHRAIKTGMDEIRLLCEDRGPNSAGLSAARERLTSASLVRSRYVSEVIVPSLLVDPDDGLRTELSELLIATAARRMVSNEHVAAWTSTSIETDWSGYCPAARDIWPIMEEQMEHERCVLITRLRQREPSAFSKQKKGQREPARIVLGEDA